MGVVVVGSVGVSLALIGCSPAPRDGADATPADAAELCGNGRLDRLGGTYAEECDEGAHNGTPEGHCTKQCWSAQQSPPVAHRQVDLGPPIAAVGALPVYAGLSISTFSPEDGQVRVWHEIDPGSGPNPRLLRVAAPVVSLASGSVFQGPAWIEQASGEPPHLYAADYIAGDPPTIRELDYPFPDGIRPELVGQTPGDPGLLIVDQNLAGELLVAMVSARSPTEVATVTLRVPAPPGTRGISVDASFYFDYGHAGSRRLVVFFDDPGSFVSIDVTYTYDPAFEFGPHELTELARGSWPFHVVAGDTHPKFCPPGDTPPELRRLVSVLADTGEIYLWPFDHGLAPGEAFPMVFARVSPGTRALRWYGLNGIGVLEADGTLKLFSDGDPCSMWSVALAPSSTVLAEPSSAMLLPLGTTQVRAVAGGVLYW